MEQIFRRLYNTFNKEYRHSFAIPVGSEKQSFPFYVDLSGGTKRFSETENTFLLKDQIVKEVTHQNDCHLFLILGGSGQGKTTFALALAKYYWSQIIVESVTSIQFKTDDDLLTLPIYIPLAYVRENWSQVLQTFLFKKGILSGAYQKIIERKNVMLILDAYSEIIPKDAGSIFNSHILL